MTTNHRARRWATTGAGLALALSLAACGGNVGGGSDASGEDADGHTLMVYNGSLAYITPLAVAEGEAPDIADYEIVTGISLDDYVLVTAPDSGFTSVEDLAAAGAPRGVRPVVRRGHEPSPSWMSYSSTSDVYFSRLLVHVSRTSSPSTSQAVSWLSSLNCW